MTLFTLWSLLIPIHLDTIKLLISEQSAPQLDLVVSQQAMPFVHPPGRAFHVLPVVCCSAISMPMTNHASNWATSSSLCQASLGNPGTPTTSSAFEQRQCEVLDKYSISDPATLINRATSPDEHLLLPQSPHLTLILMMTQIQKPISWLNLFNLLTQVAASQSWNPCKPCSLIN